MSDRIEPPLAAAGEHGTEAIAESQFPEPAPARGRSASRAVKSTLGASLFIQLLNMVSGVELARGLGPRGRGELAAAMLWPTVVGALAALGLEESMTYHVARRRDDRGRLVGSALALCVIQSVAFTALSLGVVPLALHRHDSATIGSGLVYSGYVSLNMFAVMLNGTLNGLHRYSWYNAVRVSIGVLIVTSQTLLLATHAFSVRTIVEAIIGCYVANAAFVTFLVCRARPGRLRFDLRTMRKIFAYGVRSNTSTTSSFLNQRLDQLVISAFLSARQLGLYVVAVTFSFFTPLIGASVGAATLPNVASLDTLEQRVQLSRRLVSLSLIASILASAPIVVLAPIWIKLFFGSAFTPGANITRVVAVASIALSTNRSLEAVLRGVGRPLAAGIAEMVALGATVVGLASLLPTLGLIGAAWASLLAYSVSSAWMLLRIRRVLHVPIRRLLTPDRKGVELVVTKIRALARRPSADTA